MDQQSIIEAIEGRARDARVSIRFVCHRAGIHPTTFSRWKRSVRNPEPIGANLSSLKKIEDALREIEREARRREGRRAPCKLEARV